jgi:serine protease inhibitor
MRKPTAIGLAVCLALLCIGSSPRGYRPDQVPEKLRPVVEGNTAFALELYAKLKNVEGNVFFSPYSVSSALAIAYAGARGATEEQMAEVLHLPLDQDECHAAMAKIRKSLLRADRRRNTELNVANSLWPQEKYAFHKDYVRLAEREYGASVEYVDFVSAPGAAAKKINAWVDQETRHKITQAVGPGAFSPDTRLVIVNAIYFKGEWVARFDEEETQARPFWLSDTESVDAPTMHQESEFRYAEDELVQVLELPYKKHDLSMIVLLPKERDGLAELEEQLTPESLSGWLEKLGPRNTDVLLPKLTITSRFRLAPILAAMGMPDAFDMSRADFTGITPEHPFFITGVIHAALVKVDEEGTVAAAVTVTTGGCGAMSPPPATFHADHPFIFLITDNRTGTILFMGKVVDPRG